MAGLSASRWAIPSNDDNVTTLNPAMPPFRPNGSEMLRYQTPRTTGTQEMQDYIVSMNVAQMSDMVHMHRLTGQNTRDIEDIRATVKDDIKMLEQKIQNIEMSRSRDSSPEAQYTTAKDLDYAPHDDMIKSFTIEAIVAAYWREADEREEMALQLRRQAAALSGDTNAPVQRKMIEDISPLSTEFTAGNEFVCCAKAYGSIQELLEHVEETHSSSLPSIESPRPAATESISQSVQIKAPQDASAKVKVDRLSTNATAAPGHPIAARWSPSTVRQMKPISFDIPNHQETFTFEFLRDNLGGSLWSSGFYFETEDPILPSQAYWILESECEPFIPQSPGQHGAKLTAFFNESPTPDAPTPDNYMDAPVFIKEEGKHEYRYYGNYSQTRYSDKVGYDTLLDHIPERTLRQWADRLSETGRPQWVTRALTKHFWPQPQYEGPYPTDSALNTPATVATGAGSSASGGTERRVTKALQEYAQELKDWQKEAALHTSLLTSQAILKAFKNPDSDIEPGLRLWWEYLECTKYDTGFYDMLVRFKQDPRLAKRDVSRPNPRLIHRKDESSSVPDVGGKTRDGDDVETVTALDLDEEPVVLDPVHPSPPNPKKLQNEQWGQIDTAGAEAQSKKPTMFKRIDFNNEGKQQLKIIEGQLKKAGVPAASKKPLSSYLAVKDKGHTKMVKPWEAEKESGGEPANLWRGGGDMQVAMELKEGFQDGRWKKGDLSSGNGGRSRKKGFPPHAR